MNNYPNGPEKYKSISDMNLMEAFDYIQTLSTVPESITEEYEQKKQEELKVIGDFTKRFNPMLLRDYIAKGIFSIEELEVRKLMCRDLLPVLMDYSNIMSHLPDPTQIIPNCRTELAPKSTDVYFFGIPATGKSCILGGLLSSSDRLNYSVLKAGGAYGEALQHYFSKHITPPLSHADWLTTINGYIRDASGNRTNINLIELPGESFAVDIVSQTSNSLSFEQMGTGATQLLQGDNPKEFFLVIDSSKNEVEFQYEVQREREDGSVFYESEKLYLSQQVCIKKFIELLQLPENKKIMKKVKAINFILTKADKISVNAASRNAACFEHIQTIYKNEIEELKEYCIKRGINKATKGHPVLYPCSLGEFYACDIFNFDPTDCNTIINAIERFAPKPIFKF